MCLQVKGKAGEAVVEAGTRTRTGTGRASHSGQIGCTRLLSIASARLYKAPWDWGHGTSAV